ncbi:putative EF-hand calcium-binding domain protein [Diplocarpon rosae]|nr:putative EF-hand calcium-binding domain protein [Diplocarpon rosae]
MKFLCLCGAYGSSDVCLPPPLSALRSPSCSCTGTDLRNQKFQVQLGISSSAPSLHRAPLVNELASDNTAELFFINGPLQAYPPEGFEEYFGQAPYYRFIEAGKVEGAGGDVLDRIRQFPEGATAEDQMRELMGYGSRAGSIGSLGSIGSTPESSDDGSNFGDYSYSNASAQKAMDYLYDIMEREGPFDGIIGYSEGATVAATLLLHEQRRYEREGRLPMMKCALFFAGWPPMTPELDGIVLADETDLTITIPTCHISTSDLDTVKELGDVIRQMVANFCL